MEETSENMHSEAPNTNRQKHFNEQDLNTSIKESTQIGEIDKVANEINETMTKNSEHCQDTLLVDTESETNRNISYTKERRWLSLRPLRNPGFVLFLVSNMITELTLDTPYSFLPDMMVHKGFTKNQAVWVMFNIGR